VLRRVNKDGNLVEENGWWKVEDVTESRSGPRGTNVTIGWVKSEFLSTGNQEELAKRTKLIIFEDDHQSNFSFKHALYLNVKGRCDGVRMLQAILTEEGSGIYRKGLITGKFGPLTKEAVINFQVKYEIIESETDPGAGRVGPKTRIQLNKLLGNKAFLNKLQSKYELKIGRASIILESVESLIDNPPNWLGSDFLKGASREVKIGIILAMIVQESWPEIYHFDNQLVAPTPCGRGIMQIDTDEYVGAGSGIVGYNDDGNEDLYRCRKDKSKCKCYYTNTIQGIEANIKDGLWALRDKYTNALDAYKYTDEQVINEEMSIIGKEMLWMMTIYRYNQGEPFKAHAISQIWEGKENQETVKPPWMSASEAAQWMDDVRVECCAGESISFEECLGACKRRELIRSPFYLKNVGGKLSQVGNESYFGTSGQGYENSSLAKKMVYTNTHSIISTLLSPGELHVYNYRGEATGLVNGETIEEIGNAIYARESGILVILFPAESYIYEVEGTDEGAYTLCILYLEGEEIATFTGADIPTTAGAIHDYTVDWNALARGEEGVTLQVDNDGDGTFEKTIQAGSTLDGTTTPIANQPPAIDILAPVSGETISGSHYQIQWQATDPDNVDNSLSIDLFYSTNSGSTWTSISSDEANDGVYDWNISALRGGEYWLKLVAEDPEGGTSEATVGPFTISTFEGNVILGPNPVTGAGTAFFYILPAGTSTAKLMILNIVGKPLFETSLDVSSTRFPSAGTWNPVDQDGIPLANGPYVYVLIADGKVIGQGKMVIQR
jgi:peptidoglycan hydrolase-like protein with peptidoglycan-binding domain